MKPLKLGLCAAGVTGGIVAVALGLWPREVVLPVYDKPVEFFSEGKQALLIGTLPKNIASMSADACASCHQKEHAEWKQSAHSRSVTEPVFAAAFESEPRFLCRSCHSPMEEQHPRLLIQAKADPKVLVHGRRLTTSVAFPMPAIPNQGRPFITEDNPKYNLSLANEGVNCVTCHVRDQTILTSNPKAPSNVPHPLSYSKELKTSEFCGGCHQFDIQNPQAHPFERKPITHLSELFPEAKQRATVAKVRTDRAKAFQAERAGQGVTFAAASKVPPPGQSMLQMEGDDPPIPTQPHLENQYHQEQRVQHTVDEWRISPAAAKGQNCQSCHMPTQNGRPRHNWPGRDSLAMLQQAVSMSARLNRDTFKVGDKLQAVIKLKNDAGHRFPTGDSVHAGILDVWLRDGNKTLARQVYTMSNQGASNAVFMQGNFSGNFIVQNGMEAPAVLEGPQRADTRLLPGEEATLLFTQKVSKQIAQAKNLTLRLRVYHSALHPGFRNTSIDPKLNTLRLIREQVLPVRTTAPPAPAAKAPRAQAAVTAVGRGRG